jgi:hypothetical protein
MTTKKMTVKLSKKGAEEFFFNAMCNGLNEMGGYGLSLDYDEAAYRNARKKLAKPAQAVCFEDVLMQLLRDGGGITLIDEEGEGDNTQTITLKDVHERVQDTPIEHLSDMHSGNDDATTADVILQTVFFGEVIFG